MDWKVDTSELRPYNSHLLHEDSQEGGCGRYELFLLESPDPHDFVESKALYRCDQVKDFEMRSLLWIIQMGPVQL